MSGTILCCTPIPGGGASVDNTVPRVLGIDEFVYRLLRRPDIFHVERDRRTRNMELAGLICAICAGLFLSTREIAPYGVGLPDFTDPFRGTTRVVPGMVVERPEAARPVPEAQRSTSERRSIAPPAASNRLSSGRSGGGGSARERVARTGIFGILSQPVRGIDVASGEPFSKGGIADQIDAVLLGVNGLKSGAMTGTARRGLDGIGFGAGYGTSGFGDGGIAGGIEDLIGAQSADVVTLKKPQGKVLDPTPMDLVAGSGMTSGGRSKASILRVVMQNLGVLRYAYNQRLRLDPTLKGRITVRFAIDEFGYVLECVVEESTVGDSILERMVTDKVRRWRFDRIDKPGDVTEVVYPFVFAS